MGHNRLSMLLAHLVLGFAFAIPAFKVMGRELSTSKQLGLWFSNPLTRRSPDTHFLRFGRSGGSGIGGSGSSSAGSGGVASKLHVECKARRLAATVNAYLSPTLQSLTCVSDADASSRVLCYTLFEVSRHFSLLVTERSCDRRKEDYEREDETADNEEEGSDARAATGKRADADVVDDDDDDDDDKDDKMDDEGLVNESEKGTRNWRVRQSIKQPSGRSAASQAQRKIMFARLGRRRDTFMRLGRVGLQ